MRRSTVLAICGGFLGHLSPICHPHTSGIFITLG